MKNRGIITFLALALLLGCKTQVTESKNGTHRFSETGIPPREYSVAAVLWQQHSGEYRALAYQAFNFARMQLDLLLQSKELTKNLSPS